MLLGCCHCPGDQPSIPQSNASGSGSTMLSESSGSQISTFANECAFCDVFPKRFGFTSTAGNFSFSSVGGTRNNCGGWDQYNELIYTGDSFSISRSSILGSGSGNCAVWRTADRAINTNKTNFFGVTLSPSCPDVSGTMRWELVIRSATYGFPPFDPYAFAELYCWHFGDFVFGVPNPFWHKWVSPALVPLPGSNCVIEIECSYSSSFSGFPTPTYTTNGTLAPSFTLVPT